MAEIDGSVSFGELGKELGLTPQGVRAALAGVFDRRRVAAVSDHPERIYVDAPTAERIRNWAKGWHEEWDVPVEAGRGVDGVLCRLREGPQELRAMQGILMGAGCSHKQAKLALAKLQVMSWPRRGMWPPMWMVEVPCGKGELK